MTDPTDTTPVEVMQEAVTKEQLKDFSNLLDTISSIPEQKRKLWLQIYENAITDRSNSYALFMKLVVITDTKTTEFAVHGKTLTQMIERMQKSNEQLIKLAELLAEAEKKDEAMDPDAMFDRIRKGA